ncbi:MULTISPECIES: DNA (cytosine-5-)-methyltransferase [unclassified Clostridioides]|uniref:DNA (cytosine-5-)-methyltransferase n=1 Tax=unclassified Clostridioides TaxID=2635829 RepID=UPI001D10CA5D|nr:DNA (cytosine-5-)-methyltransferase [Clostridioides sp. ZZV14-6045]MCC0740782.1 DNA (cytosine-5-)-methyltransferase [Clostridioides sp. ZZV14-5902]
MKKYNVLDLFAGCGGLGYGFKKNGVFNIKLANDIWEPAKLTYEENNPEIPFILDDIKNIDKDLIDKYFENGVDVIIGGPPCQGFSMCGTRNVHDERNDLFYEYARIVNFTRPYIFIMENVKGILSMKNKEGNSVVDSIVKEFDSIGYNIHYKILNSKNYSVPQARERVIFVGTRKDIANNYEYPEFDLENEFYTVGDALVSLPNKDSLDGQLTYNYKASDYLEKIKGCGKIYNHEIPKHKDNVTYRMSLVPQGGNWKDIPEEFRAGGNHSNAYRRLDSSKPSVTIKHAYKSMIIHPIYDRCLSIREVARLQSFPDNYIFKGNKTSQYQQLANAVPPGLAVALSNSVVSYLNKNNLNIAVKKEYNKSEIQQLKDEIQLLKLEIENLKKDASTLKSSNLQIAMFDVIK